jgi:Fe-S cluster biogenesis protein NfuA
MDNYTQTPAPVFPCLRDRRATFGSVEPSSQSALAPAINRENLVKVCRDVLAPLIEADGGEMYLVGIIGDEIHIHLAGTCAGCPGSTLTKDRVLGPALHSIAPKATLRVTTGIRIPTGAVRIESKSEAKA